MDKNKARDIEAAALLRARSNLSSVLQQLTVSTSVIPKSVSQGSYQRAVQWKDLAKKWRAKASKGVPNTSDIRELEDLYSEARRALKLIESGSV